MKSIEISPSQYVMVIDADRCTGCGACMVACAIENNVAPAHPDATDRTGVTWMKVVKVSSGNNGDGKPACYLPLPCQQCAAETPCVTVCPQNAVEVDQQTGIVFQMSQRCLGCRYCMAACPYHARYFNWWDPEWPEGMEQTLNPDVAPRMRGVVEKCNFCHGRYQAARASAAEHGQASSDPVTYEPACAQACPTRAIKFGTPANNEQGVGDLVHSSSAFRLLPRLGTEPRVYYLSKHKWIRQMAQMEKETSTGEEVHG
ncbi:MAG: 4Fe-4S dicluster domain-containing protein [Ignavibacteria bacterium]|nr:4Fe-4S dicluster domain-containing protein [Ignavibacteria bacterium]